MKQNEVFFYQGRHKAGAHFIYDADTEQLSVVTIYDLDFDNDEALNLKKLDQPKIYKTLNNVASDEVKQGCETLLDEMEREAEGIFKF